MLYPDLKGKTALITGAGRPTGIGFSIARSLAASGMDCILADLPGEETACTAASRPCAESAGRGPGPLNWTSARRTGRCA